MTPDACSGCGSTTWIASVVDSNGARRCAACYSGLTPLIRRGVPIGAGTIVALDTRPVPRVRGRRKR